MSSPVQPTDPTEPLSTGSTGHTSATVLQAGRYGGMAFALALAAALTTGYGVASADSSSPQGSDTSQSSPDSQDRGSGAGSDEAGDSADTPASAGRATTATRQDDENSDDTEDAEVSGNQSTETADVGSEAAAEEADDSAAAVVDDRDDSAQSEPATTEFEAEPQLNAVAEADLQTDVVAPPSVADTPVASTESGIPTEAQKTTSAIESLSVNAEPEQQPVDSPVAWTLLAWVRRNFFNQAPVVHYNPADNVQGPLGVITGSIGATDPEGDALKYRITKNPLHGTVVIDQQTGTFSYTTDLDYAQAGGTDAFVVRVTDGKLNLFHFLRPDLGIPRVKIGVDVESILPSADRFIVPLPDSVEQPQNPVYTADGKALVFRATPTGATRSEIYRVNPDGTGLQCLTCGLAPELAVNLSKPFVFDDGNRILLSAGTQSDSGGETADHYVLECAGGVNSCGSGTQLVKIAVPTDVPSNVVVVQKQRELRVAPDGLHVGFTQLLGSGTATQLVSSVGLLERTETGYVIVDAHVVYVGGELKNFTSDGKGVIITDFSGKYEAGNADNVLVNLTDGTVTRLTANLDYDESVDVSPNGKWLAVGSSRTLDYLTPMSQVVRPTFVPAYVVFPTFQAKKGSLNQAWVVSRDDELAGENGIYLGDTTGEYNSVPVANWSPDGTQIAFWERSKTDPADTRLVLATLHNIDGGTRVSDVSTPDVSSWATPLSSVTISPTPLEPSRAGKVGGSAVVTSVKTGNITTMTVTYTDFEDEQGFILNGTETTVANATLTNITYNAHITVTGSDGSDRGYLTAENVKIVNQLSMTGVIESSVEGHYLVMGTPAA